MSAALQVPAELKPVNMNVHRCYECGRCWALEGFASSAGECPCCARRKIDKLEATLAIRDRAIAALRGVLGRMKGARRRAD